VRIIETSPQGMLEMAIVENVQRTDLNPIDRANSFERLIKEFSLTNSDICTRIGKSPAFVSNTLRLLELPDALKDGLISGVITEGHARALAAIPDTQTMIEAYKMILREGGSVRRAEELSRRFKKGIHRSKPSDGFDNKTANDGIDNMAAAIGNSIGENVHVKLRRSRVETAIHIVIKGNPEQTETQIQKIYDLLVVPQSIRDSEPVSPPLAPEPSAPVNTYSNPFEPMLERTSTEEVKSDNNVPKDTDNFSEY
jgi:ParB family chromosome partitioning protein